MSEIKPVRARLDTAQYLKVAAALPALQERILAERLSMPDVAKILSEDLKFPISSSSIATVGKHLAIRWSDPRAGLTADEALLRRIKSLEESHQRLQGQFDQLVNQLQGYAPTGPRIPKNLFEQSQNGNHSAGGNPQSVFADHAGG